MIVQSLVPAVLSATSGHCCGTPTTGLCPLCPWLCGHHHCSRIAISYFHWRVCTIIYSAALVVKRGIRLLSGITPFTLLIYPILSLSFYGTLDKEALGQHKASRRCTSGVKYCAGVLVHGSGMLEGVGMTLQTACSKIQDQIIC